MKYQIIVSNIGQVCDTDIEESAESVFFHYVGQSRNKIGRAAGESVTMIEDGSVINELFGTNNQGTKNGTLQRPT